MVQLEVRNISGQQRPVRKDALQRLAEKIVQGEGVDDAIEVSLLLCDDHFIADLNQQYRDKEGPTDVLSFEQDSAEGVGPRLLGDIVISLDTVARYCDEVGVDPKSEVKLLFCHGMLHLLGYRHDTAEESAAMQARQAEYLDVALDAAWKQPSPETSAAASRGKGK
jgi:probable rRNA maturation factor